MKVTGSSIQQLDKGADGKKPKSKCRKWRLWASTDQGRKSKRFEGTYSQAQEALKAFVDELSEHIPNSDTFGAYAVSWASWRAKSCNLSPNTVLSERTCVNALRKTDLDGMRMDAISADDCRDALLWLGSHTERGTERKPSSLAKLHQVLGAIMRQAVDDGKLAVNPMSSVKRPKARPVEREALLPDELQLFLNRVDELPLDGKAMALYLMACLGLRCGEACALKDDEVHDGLAFVTSTVRAADDSVGAPKSEHGKRVLPMPPRLSAKVGEWRDLRDALGLHDAKTLCCKLDGSRMSTSAMSNWWRGGKDYEGARDKLGCHGMTLHQLRHSNLSMMARHMSPFDLQHYAGWSSLSPAQIYIHGDMDAVRKAVDMAWDATGRTNHAPDGVLRASELGR